MLYVKITLYEACLICQSNQKIFKKINCQKVLGMCNHCFHMHCIDIWIKKGYKYLVYFKNWIIIFKKVNDF